MLAPEADEILHGIPRWHLEAACADPAVDPDIFFPERGQGVRAARAVCEGCGVRAKCLEWALESDQEFGVFGGTSVRERRTLKAQRP